NLSIETLYYRPVMMDERNGSGHQRLGRFSRTTCIYSFSWVIRDVNIPGVRSTSFRFIGEYKPSSHIYIAAGFINILKLNAIVCSLMLVVYSYIHFQSTV